MSVDKKTLIPVVGFFVLLIAIMGVGYFTSKLLCIFDDGVCHLFFIVVTIVLSSIYFYIDYRLDSKFL